MFSACYVNISSWERNTARQVQVSALVEKSEVTAMDTLYIAIYLNAYVFIKQSAIIRCFLCLLWLFTIDYCPYIYAIVVIL